MKKILSIGDVHGDSNWKTILFGAVSLYDEWKASGVVKEKYPIDDYDLIIFTGDYVDTRNEDITEHMILDNLNDVIFLKKAMHDKVILLWGNHDIHYINPIMRCSGYNPLMQEALGKVFTDNRRLFNVAHQVGNHLWTHAGLTSGWMYKHIPMFEDAKHRNHAAVKDMVNDPARLAEMLNVLHLNHDLSILKISASRGGDSAVPGPLWSDISEMEMMPAQGYHQIVGHSPVEMVYTKTFCDVTSVTFINTLEIGDRKPYAIEL